MVRTGWDGYNKKPTYETVDPMLIIPDPDGDYIQDTYKFIGFESTKFKEELPEDWQNTDKLVDETTQLVMRAKQLKVNAGMSDTYQLERKVIYSCFEYWK
jgi:20S proteasome alpha/beta subunit